MQVVDTDNIYLELTGRPRLSMDRTQPVHCDQCEFILDIHFDQNITHIWTKTVEGKTKHYPLHYHPRIYIADPLKETIYQYNDKTLEESAMTVSMHPDVISVRIIDCYLNSKSDDVTKAVEIELYSMKVLPQVISDLKDKNFYLYNIDINKRQHFFLDTNAYPLGACHINIQKDLELNHFRFEPLEKRNELYRNDYSPIPGSVELKLDRGIDMHDDVSKIDYFIPDLRILRITPQIKKKGSFPTLEDSLHALDLQYGIYRNGEIEIQQELTLGQTTKKYRNHETKMLLEMVEYIQDQDIDIILLPQGDKFTLNYLAHRARDNDIQDKFVLGRIPNKPQYAKKQQKGQTWVTYGQILNKAAVSYLPGRIHLDYDNSFILYEGELPGVIDLSRMAATPIERTSRASIGTTLTGIEFVVSQNTTPKTLVPENKVGGEQFKDADVLLVADNGGVTYPAIPGVYDQVWAIDYTSLYPMIMMNHNVGSESILCEHEECRGKNMVPELNYHICDKRVSVVTRTMKLLLAKRVTMKYLKKTLKDKKRVARYKGMDSALKWILVCAFGYLGFKNGRWGSIESHQTVTAYARRYLLQARLIVEEEGFGVICGIVDSLFIRALDPIDNTQQKIDYVSNRISKEVGIPMDQEGKFNWVVFCNVRDYAEVSALNRYFGYFSHGELKLRGIESRKRSVSQLELDFQDEVLQHLSSAQTTDQFMDLIAGTYEILFQYKQRLNANQMSPFDLIKKYKTHIGVGNYKMVNSVQALTAKAYDHYGKSLQPGQNMEFVMAMDRARSIKRITIGPNVTEQTLYDAQWYGRLLEKNLEQLVGPAQLQHYKQIKYTDHGEMLNLNDFEW